MKVARMLVTMVVLLAAPASNAAEKRIEDPQMAKARRGVNAFSIALFKAVSANRKDENTIVCPVSVANVLAILAAGGSPDVEHRLRKAIAPELDRDEFHSSLTKLFGEITSGAESPKATGGAGLPLNPQMPGIRPEEQRPSDAVGGSAGRSDGWHPPSLPRSCQYEERSNRQVLGEASPAVLTRPLDLSANLDSQGQARTRITNALFFQRNELAPLYREFQTIAEKQYRANLSAVDFGVPAQACEQINRFIWQQTGQQDALLSPDAISLATQLVTVNTTVFQGAWREPFERKATKNDTFRTSRSAVRVPFMTQTSSFEIVQLRDQKVNATFVKLPYLGNYEMHVIVPDSTSTLNDVIDWLSVDALNRVLHLGMVKSRIELHLPKVSTVSEYRLSGPLRDLQLNAVFANGAFPEINGENLILSEAYSRVCLDIDENGSKMSCVTAAVASPISFVIEPPPVVVRIDRPFLLMVLNADTGSSGDRTILFLGKICDPKGAS